jgi:hypothetical protein
MQQKGLALLVLVILIVLTFSAYYFSRISLTRIDIENAGQTQAALVKAKKALLAYAVTNWRSNDSLSSIGGLPCPDLNDTLTSPEGEQEPSCGTAYANAIGYFPWRTLNIDAPYSGDGECLLYAVSPGYKPAPAAALNPDSYGQFQIVDSAGAVLQGNVPEERPVAVILAAGKALASQARNYAAISKCGLDYGNIPANMAAYLDNDGTTDNAAIDPGVDNNIDRFVQRYDGSEDGPNPLNDRLVTITHEELWQALDSAITGAEFDNAMRYLTEAVAMCFAAYGADATNANHTLPMPAALDLNGGEYRRNIDYVDSADFTTAFAGRLPYEVTSANFAIGHGSEDKVFDNTFCDNLNLPSGAAAGINFSDDTGSDSGEYFDLWQNWKDHFFYAVSKQFKPDGAGNTVSCSSDCLAVNATKYAAIVFFSGHIQGTQTRYAPPFDADNKGDVINYLENNNAADFPDNAGNAVYEPVDGLTSNDVMFCIKQDMSVVECT